MTREEAYRAGSRDGSAWRTAWRGAPPKDTEVMVQCTASYELTLYELRWMHTDEIEDEYVSAYLQAVIDAGGATITDAELPAHDEPCQHTGEVFRLIAAGCAKQRAMHDGQLPNIEAGDAA